jgi:ATP-dependent DNA helicase PIF1
VKVFFVTGSPGVGNTELIKLYINKIYKQTKIICITSTTDISELLFEGTTLHSNYGVDPDIGSVDQLCQKIFKSSYLIKRWYELKVLVIYDVFTLSMIMFDKLEEIARRVRHNDIPFGGIQLIISGNLIRLPCWFGWFLF